MLRIKTNTSDRVWNLIGNIFSRLSNLIILPLVLDKLNTNELNIYFVLMSLNAFVILLDFGFNSNISRSMTLAISGVKNLKKTGYSIAESKTPNIALFNDIYKLSKIVYFIIGCFGSLLLMALGSFYFSDLILKVPNGTNIWNLNIVVVTITIYFNYLLPALKGLGLFKEINKIQIFSRLIYLLIALILLYLNYGLLSIVVSNLISQIIFRFLGYRIIKRTSIINNIKTSSARLINVFQRISYNTWRMGILVISGFTLSRGIFLLSTKFLSSSEINQYGILVTIGSILIAISNVLLNPMFPQITQNLSINKTKIAVKTFFKYHYRGLKYAILTSLFILIFLNPILEILYDDSKVISIPAATLCLYLIIIILEANHSNYASFIVSWNKIPFLKSSILTTVLMLSISGFGLQYFNFKIFEILFCQLIIQLLYNNWKWPTVVHKKFNISIIKSLRLQ